MRGFYQGFQHRETDESTRPLRPSAFIVSRCLERLMKPEARVVEMASQTSVKILWNFFPKNRSSEGVINRQLFVFYSYGK